MVDNVGYWWGTECTMTETSFGGHKILNSDVNYTYFRRRNLQKIKDTPYTVI